MSLVYRVLIAVLAVLVWAPPAASARMLIYVDFDGHAEPSYNGGAIAVAAYAGGPSSRQEVLRRVREDFAPFDVMFITSDDLAPGQLPPGIGQGYNPQDPAIRVAIGGTVADVGASGLATDPYSVNTVWVAEFSGATRRSDREIANTASHELGHAFGHLAAYLQPHPAFRIASTIAHYLGTTGPNDPNPFHQATHDLVPQGKTQIMGGARAAVRDIWWRDLNVAKGVRVGGNPNDPRDWHWTWQDDILSLAAVLGLRPDDHADRPQDGTAMTPFTGQLPPDETRLDGSGIVEMDDASWPGMCPPVPRWASCPEEGEPHPPAEADWGQSVVMAVTKDFFRFDIVNTGPMPRLFVSVDTIDVRGTTGYAGNADLDLEVWFNDPASGWIDITARGVRGDGSLDPWAEWTATAVGNGQYAVAVKGHGGYGDLGGYRVRARGTNGLQLAAPALGNLNPAEGFDVGSLIALLERVPGKADLIQLVAGLAESGTVAGPSRGDATPDWPPSADPSKRATALVTDALHQSSALKVVAQVVAWHALKEEEALHTYRRLAEVLARFDESR